MILHNNVIRKRGLSQRKLAQLAKVPFRTIQLLEKGGHDPQLSTLQKVAVGLGRPRSALKRRLTSLFQTPVDSVVLASERIADDGGASWKIWLFNFVDAFRKDPNEELVQEPPIREMPPKVQALLASTVEMLCEETGVGIPAWCESVLPLSKPWFVSETENLKAMAITESPAHFRKRNLFVLENFLRRA